MTSHKDQKQYWARENEPYSIVTVNEFAKAFQSFHEGRRLQDELAIPFDKSKSHPAALTTHKYGASKKELLKACFSREFLLMKRNSFVYIFKLSSWSKVNSLTEQFVFSFWFILWCLKSNSYLRCLDAWIIEYPNVTNIVDETWIGAQREFCVCCKSMNLYPLMT